MVSHRVVGGKITRANHTQYLQTGFLTGDLALYNIITLIAAKYIEELVKLEDFIEPDIISDFAISII